MIPKTYLTMFVCLFCWGLDQGVSLEEVNFKQPLKEKIPLLRFILYAVIKQVPFTKG